MSLPDRLENYIRRARAANHPQEAILLAAEAATCLRALNASLKLIPDPLADPAKLAAWYASSGPQAQERLKLIRERLTEAMTQGGDFPGLGLEHTTEWAPDAAEEFPDLVRSRSITAEVTEAPAFARLVELITEQTPDARITTAAKLDGRRANQVILRGGEHGHRLQELRRTRARLVIRP